MSERGDQNIAITHDGDEWNVGACGESLIAGWATQIGATVNKSAIDRFGWDLFVEFKQKIDPKIPLDEQNTNIKYLIQVKPTCTSKTSVRGKISAFHHLVGDWPAFIVHVEYDQNKNLKRARLLHIWETEITKILKSVRECELDKAPNHLRKVSLNLKSSIEINEQNFKQVLFSFIKKNVFSYLEEKNRIRGTCGYSAESVTGEIEIKENDIGRFVNMTVGLAGSVPVTRGKISRSRFEISLPEYDEIFGEGELHFKAQSACKGALTAISEAAGLHVDLEVDVYAREIPNTDPPQIKIHARSFFVSLIMDVVQAKGHKSQLNLSWRFPSDTKASLKDLRA